MAYENLKTAIKQAIKQNGNQEITGNLLQSTLLNIVNTIGADYKFLGFTTPSTVPPTSEEGRLSYFASVAGEYVNFPTTGENTHIVIGEGLYLFTKEANSEYWKANALVDIVQESGEAEDKVMSQKALTDLSLLGNISLTTIDTSLYPLKDGYVNNKLKFNPYNGCKSMTKGPSVKKGDIVLIYHKPYKDVTSASLLDKTTNEYSKLDFLIPSQIVGTKFVLSFGMVNKDSTLILSSMIEDIEKIKYAIIETSSQSSTI